MDKGVEHSGLGSWEHYKLSISASKQKSLAVTGLLFGAVAWGSVWYPYRILAEAGLPGIQSNLAVYIVALLLGCLMFGRQLWRERAFSWLALSMGLAAGWSNVGYILAVLQGEVMRILLLFYLSPLWTVLLSHFLLDERSDKKELMVMVMSVCGMLVMLWQGFDNLPIPQSGAEWLALSAGFTFALSNVLVRRATHLSVPTKSFWTWVGVCVICLSFLSIEASPWPAMLKLVSVNWELVLAVGACLFSLTLAVQFGVTHIAVNRAAIIFMFELVVGAITSYFLAGEVMSAREWIGGTMIICAALFEANRASQ
ncbi:MAG: DMT family transporter [Methylophilales bacterium]|nr:DMT family transporter [Methylophilales bacterium]